MEYKIIFGGKINVEKEVNKKIKKGFKPIGSPSFNYTETELGSLFPNFAQAIIKNKKNKNE